MYLAWRIMLEKILHRYISRTKKISTTWGKKILTQTKSPIHHHPPPPPPPPPEKVNLYTESVFLLASVMVKINSVKSWWGKGLHLPSAGLLVQTRKNSKKQKRKNSRFTIQLFATKLFEYSLFFLKQKKSKFIIFSQTNLFFQQKARLSLQMMVTSARKK